MSLEDLLGSIKIRDEAKHDLQQQRYEEQQQQAAEEEQRRQQRQNTFRSELARLFAFSQTLQLEIPRRTTGDRQIIQGYEFFLPDEEGARHLSVTFSCQYCGLRFERVDVKRLADVGELDEEYGFHLRIDHPESGKPESI